MHSVLLEVEAVKPYLFIRKVVMKSEPLFMYMYLSHIYHA